MAVEIDDLQKIRARDATINALKEEIAGLNKHRKQQDAEIDRLKELLEESFKLQVHYAELLNMHDGGERIVFDSIEQFEERLKMLAENYRKAAQPQKGESDE